MLKPCAKNSASPGRRFGAIASAYSPRWVGVRREHHDHVGPGAGLGGRGDRAGPAASARGRDFDPVGQADADLAARVAQAERVRVALGAVAEDGDLAALDEAEVGVGVVVDGGHGWQRPFVSGSVRSVESQTASAAGPAVPGSGATVSPRSVMVAAAAGQSRSGRCGPARRSRSAPGSPAARRACPGCWSPRARSSSGLMSTTLAWNTRPPRSSCAAQRRVDADLDQRELALHRGVRRAARPP